MLINKPVAWMVNGIAYATEDVNKEESKAIPLYTHPVKELTDEEIIQVMMNVYSDTVPPIRGIDFAKAILRKAQEK